MSEPDAALKRLRSAAHWAGSISTNFHELLTLAEGKIKAAGIGTPDLHLTARVSDIENLRITIGATQITAELQETLPETRTDRNVKVILTLPQRLCLTDEAAA